MSSLASHAIPAASYPLILGATADGEFRIALRCDFLGAAGGPLQASMFVSDGSSLGNTRAVSLDLRMVFEETTDRYGAPPPPRGGEWAALQRIVTHMEVQIERSAAGDVESVIAKHLHGQRLVDVRLLSRYDAATLQPAPPEAAYAWFRVMLEAREVELVATSRRLYDVEHSVPPPGSRSEPAPRGSGAAEPPPPPGQQRWKPSRRPLAQKVRGKRLQLEVQEDTSKLEL